MFIYNLYGYINVGIICLLLVNSKVKKMGKVQVLLMEPEAKSKIIVKVSSSPRLG
jgi:hypothetical protein